MNQQDAIKEAVSGTQEDSAIPKMSIFLRLKDVQKRIPMSESTIRLLIEKGEFPAPKKRKHGRSIFWLESDITEYQEQQFEYIK